MKTVIIGGGVSGLSALHFLKKNNPDSGVILLEKNDYCGGTIHTQEHEKVLFEMGPNGFLGGAQATWELIEDLGLTEAMIDANAQAKKRYICIDHQLHELPTSPPEFLTFPLLRKRDKLRLLGDWFMRPGVGVNESIFDFCSRRFGERMATTLVDPAIRGIFGGDIRRLSMQAAFPNICQLEQRYGSVAKGMIAQRKLAKLKIGRPPAKKKMHSFENGMGQLMGVLAERYKDSIVTGEAVSEIRVDNQRYLIDATSRRYDADHVIVCTPAYIAAEMIKVDMSELAQMLKRIVYVPIAVIGLTYDACDVNGRAQGFGYLKPSSQEGPVMGVLFEDQIFDRGQSKRLFRVMLGGRHHPEIMNESIPDLVNEAREELKQTLGIAAEPEHVFHALWPKAIPQYESGYTNLREEIQSFCDGKPGLYLRANYLDGIAFNDCIVNAKKLVEERMMGQKV